VLYDLCCEALNINGIEDMDLATRLACLSAYETFILNSKNVARLEKFLREQHSTVCYIDPKLRKDRIHTGQMIEILSNVNYSPSVSPMVIGLSVFCALISGAPSYGVGYAIGEAVGLTHGVDLKIQLSKVTGAAMTVVLGDGGKYLAYYGADRIVNATLKRAFAKVFEMLGMLTGAAAGGLVGLIVFDLTYKTLSSLCSLCLHLHKNMGPTLAQEINPRVIECLLDLPAEVFSEEHKAKLTSMTKGTLFHNPIVHPATGSKNPSLIMCPSLNSSA
jgi:hypothetical protein